MKEVITLFIYITSMFSVKDDTVSVNMVNFTGSARGEYFNGEILPGAVDTQTRQPDGSVELSARYMLKGIDSAGDSCYIYVANEVNASTPKGYTSPSIVTNSTQIASLAKDGLVGKIDSDGGTLVIRIYSTAKQ